MRNSLRALILAGLASTSCGGGAPWLHPAHTLPGGSVEASAGIHGRIALGGSHQDIESGRSVNETGAEQQSQRFTRGALQHLVVAPGVAPYVAARAGLGGANEGQIEFTGRRLRVGARHAFEWDSLALSIGAGASSLRSRGSTPNDDGDGLVTSGFELHASGFGFDLPVVFGWSSPGDVVTLWLGARPSFDSLRGDFPFAVSGGLTDAPTSAQLFQVSGLTGLSVGISPVWVRLGLELGVGRAATEITLPWADAPQEQVEDSFTAVSVTPAGALAVEF